MMRDTDRQTEREREREADSKTDIRRTTVVVRQVDGLHVIVFTTVNVNDFTSVKEFTFHDRKTKIHKLTCASGSHFHGREIS